MAPRRVALFGGERPWTPADWTDSDDRVRGGASHSYMQCSPLEPVARFCGNLDTTALGGAGFASQRTTRDEAWDLSESEGIEIVTAGSDDKRYTLTLKDELLPPDPATGREQSTISYEFDFVVKVGRIRHPRVRTIRVPWSDFKATYRGREKEDAPPLDLTKVARLSFMMRSFFGTQQGDFRLDIRSVSAYSRHDEEADEIDAGADESFTAAPYRDNDDGHDNDANDHHDGNTDKSPLNEKYTTVAPSAAGFWTNLFTACTNCTRAR